MPDGGKLGGYLARWFESSNNVPVAVVGRSGTGRQYEILASLSHTEAKHTGQPPQTIRSRILQGLSPDVTIVPKAAGIAEVRQALEGYENRPLEFRNRYVLVWDADQLSKASCDTLLKVLEEPPAHLRIMATVSSTASMPSALASRMFLLGRKGLTNKTLSDLIPKVPALQSCLGTLNMGIVPTTSTVYPIYATQLDLGAVLKGLFDTSVGEAQEKAKSLSDTIKARGLDPKEALTVIITAVGQGLVARHMKDKIGLDAAQRMLSGLIEEVRIAEAPPRNTPIARLVEAFIVGASLINLRLAEVLDAKVTSS